jgi:hypothetical protein
MNLNGNLDGEHPVKKELLLHVADALRRKGNVKVEEAVLKNGRPFVGIKRPSGYPLLTIKQCFTNSARLAYRERGTYVEGFVSVAGELPIHHAWVTLDGIHAIDVTLRGPASDCQYFGIPFSLKVLEKWTERRPAQGAMLDGMNPIEQMEELLEDAVREPASLENGLSSPIPI